MKLADTVFFPFQSSLSVVFSISLSSPCLYFSVFLSVNLHPFFLFFHTVFLPPPPPSFRFSSFFPSLCFPLFRPNPLFWPSGQIFSSISPQCEVTQSAPITILVTEINNPVPYSWIYTRGERRRVDFYPCLTHI